MADDAQPTDTARRAWAVATAVLAVLWGAAVVWRVRRVLGGDVPWPFAFLSFLGLGALGLGVVGGAWERAQGERRP